MRIIELTPSISELFTKFRFTTVVINRNGVILSAKISNRCRQQPGRPKEAAGLFVVTRSNRRALDL